MAGVTTYTCIKCRPIDTKIIEAYEILTNTSKAVSQQEADRVAAENARVSAEEGRTTVFNADHGTAVADHGIAVEDHGTAGSDHNTAVSDHNTAAEDHTLAVSDHQTAGEDHSAVTTATSRANDAAAAAEHMVDIHQGPEGKSAYEVAVEEGFVGTEDEWLESLNGTGINRVEQTETSIANGGTNKVRITLTDGTYYDIQIKNGSSSNGLFPTSSALEAACPSPKVGDYAFVGDGFPADIYVCETAGTWTDSGEDFDGDNVDLTDYAKKEELTQLEQKVGEVEQEATMGAELSTIATTNLNKFRINNDCLTFDQITANHWYVRYIPVTKGDIVYLTASNSSAQPIKYGFSENQPADGVAVIDGVYLTSVTSVDVLLFSPVTGYFAYACYDVYFTDAVVKRGTASTLAGVVGNLVNADSNRFVKNDNTRQYISEENKNTIAYNLGLDAENNLVQKYINNITLGYYVNDSGVLTRLANTANIKIPIDNTLGYMFVKKLGVYANVNVGYRFFDSSDNFISYTFNNGNSAAPNQGNGLYIVKLPADVSYIRINVEPGKENLVQVYQEIPATDEYTDRELITDKASQISIGHIFSTTGEVEANNNIKNTTFIPCNTGDAFRVADWYGSYTPDQFSSGVGCYFDANMGYLGVVEADTEVYDWVAPEGAKYVSFIYAINDNATISVKRITTTSIKGKILPSAVLSNSMWNGKIWVGFGASMVAQSSSYVGLKWSPMVEAATGLVFKNCGIGGTPLAGDYTNAFWKRIQPVIDYNPDVVTILGGYNDLYYDVPLGTSAEFDKAVAEKDCETFLGAYSYIIETLLNWKKALRIVLMTPSYAHTNGADHTPGIGLTYKDYADATIQVAEYYCLPVIDLYRNMGINKLTQGTTYTRGDKIHWNARASQIAASLVIAKLNEINNAVPIE